MSAFSFKGCYCSNFEVIIHGLDAKINCKLTKSANFPRNLPLIIYLNFLRLQF